MANITQIPWWEWLPVFRWRIVASSMLLTKSRNGCHATVRLWSGRARARNGLRLTVRAGRPPYYAQY